MCCDTCVVISAMELCKLACNILLQPRLGWVLPDKLYAVAHAFDHAKPSESQTVFVGFLALICDKLTLCNTAHDIMKVRAKS